MKPLRKDLRSICADGAAASVMVGIGENYLPAFVLALTASQVACGLVATVPLVLGAGLQLAAPYLLGRVRSHRLWVVFCAAVQGLTFVPLLAGAALGSMPTVLVFGVIAVYWATGLGGGPAWNVWVGTLVPARIRSRFFARRTLLCQAGILAGFVVGGVALQCGKGAGTPLAAFSLLFAVAAASRFYSAGVLARQSDAALPASGAGRGMGALLRSFREDADPRVLLYMLAMQMAVQVSGPYFTPYMFVQLELSYWGYVALVCAAYAAKMAFLPALGGLVERAGPKRVLWICGLGIVPLPVLWMASDSFLWLTLVQLFSGAVWAGYELAMLLLFFHGIPAEKRVGVLTVFNLANAAAYFAGSLLGGAMLSCLGTSPHGYAMLFAASTVARLASMLLLVPSGRFSLAGLAVMLRPMARPAATLAPACAMPLKMDSRILPLPPEAIREPLAAPPLTHPAPLAASRADFKPHSALADAA